MKKYRVEYQWQSDPNNISERIDDVKEIELPDNTAADDQVFRALLSSEHDIQEHFVFIKGYTVQQVS